MVDLGNRVSIYQPEQEGLKFPEEPHFNSNEELRLYRKKRLVAACHFFAQQKLDYGVAGHLTIRDYAVNRAGFVLHAAVHEEHPDILAMCHAHTVYGTAFAALGKPLAPITQDACAFFEDHTVIKEDAGAVAVEDGVIRAAGRTRRS